MTQEPNKPRIWLGIQIAGAYRYDVPEGFPSPAEFIEKSHADALEQRVKELEAEVAHYFNQRNEFAAELESSNASLTRKLADALHNHPQTPPPHQCCGRCSYCDRDCLRQDSEEVNKAMDAELNGDK